MCPGKVITTHIFCFAFSVLTLLFHSSVSAFSCTPSVNISTSSLTICKGNSITLATTTVNGGTTPSYQWKLNGSVTGGNTPDLTLASPVNGDQVIVIMTSSDTCANPVAASDTVTITVSDVTANVTASGNASCGALDGKIDITGVAGGTAPYQYALDGGAFQPGTSFFSVGGIHFVQVKDANGCSLWKNVTVPITGNITNAQLGSTYQTCGKNDGEVRINGVTGGTAPYTFTLVESGSTQTSSTFPVIFSGVQSGLYRLSIKGADNCEFIVYGVWIGVNGSITSIPYSTTPETCAENDGSISVNQAGIAGGVAPFQFSVDGGSTYQGPVFTGLKTGSYTVIVKDVNTCTSSVSVYVAGPSYPVTTYVTTSATCDVRTGTLNVLQTTGGTAPYTYVLNSTNYGTAVPSGRYPVGEFTLLVTDLAGCKETIVSVVDDDCRYIPLEIGDVVSPNSDGYNDTWYIKGIERYPQARIHVYDRWGQQVYYKDSYSNINGWDGTWSGNVLPAATYYYLIEIDFKDKGKPVRETGYVNVVR